MRKFILACLLAILPFAAQAEDKTLARVNKAQEINCGVYTLGSIFSYDPAGKPQGFTVDLMNEIGARTGLKIRYSEISSFASLRQDLDGGKYDMVCAPVLLIPATAMKYLPSNLIFIDPINIYADGDADLSGIKSLQDLDNPKYTFVGMDGELGGLYAPKIFPKAKLNLLSQGSLVPQMFLELHGKKANFVILSRLGANAYLKDNPGKLKQVTADSIARPSIRLFYPNEAYGLKANIDAILDELQRDGTMERLLKAQNLYFKD